MHTQTPAHTHTGFRGLAAGQAAGCLSLWLLEQGLYNEGKMHELILGFTQAD